jgi:hypothetical protein
MCQFRMILKSGLTKMLIAATRLLSFAAMLGAVDQIAADDPDFYRDVRPILAKACFHCHGPDEETRRPVCDWTGLRACLGQLKIDEW